MEKKRTVCVFVNIYVKVLLGDGAGQKPPLSPDSSPVILNNANTSTIVVYKPRYVPSLPYEGYSLTKEAGKQRLHLFTLLSCRLL